MDYDDPTLAHPMPSGGSYTISAHSQVDVENFAGVLRNADEQGVRAGLQRDPSLAVAMLPSGWPVCFEHSVFPKPAIIDLMIASGADRDARSPEGETICI